MAKRIYKNIGIRLDLEKRNVEIIGNEQLNFDYPKNCKQTILLEMVDNIVGINKKALHPIFDNILTKHNIIGG